MIRYRVECSSCQWVARFDSAGDAVKAMKRHGEALVHLTLSMYPEVVP